MEFVLRKRLRRKRHSTGNGSANSSDPFLIGGMLAVGFRSDEHTYCSMRLRVQDLNAPRRAARIARSVEDRGGVRLLRFVVENQDDFSVRVDSLVIVVM